MSNTREPGIIDRHARFTLPMPHGVFLIDKPKGITSFSVVARLRRLLDIRKVGHAGTLDPMATGLLICCVGRQATKLVEDFQNLDKVYEGNFRLGIETDTFDADGQVVCRRTWQHVTDEKILNEMSSLEGAIRQLTPAYSAVKVQGEPLYRKARRGETVSRPPRWVDVYSFVFLGREQSDVRFRVVCSKGTYVRSLAHDVGRQLNCGAHLIALRRTEIGPYTVDRAWNLDTLEDYCEAQKN